MGKKKESGPRERIRTGPAFSSRHRSISWLRLITSLIESAPKCACVRACVASVETSGMTIRRPQDCECR